MDSLDINREIEELQKDEIRVDREIQEVENKINFYKNFAWSLIAVGFVIGALGVIEHFLGSDMQLNIIGDYTGGVVASMWSLAGLFIIYVAFLGQKQQILHQKMELKYNRFEVKATRIELEGQKQQMIEQNKTLRQQRFENTFFQMVNLHHQIVGSISKVLTAGIVREGRNNFRVFYEKLFKDLNEYKRVGMNRFVDLDVAVKIYVKFFEENQSDLSHYFRNIYTITKFIHLSEVDDKQKYADILRAQLSSHELLLLFYNGLSDYGNKKFKPLIEKYALLKNMPQQSLIEVEHVKEYISTAFH